MNNVNPFIHCPTRYIFISGSYDCSRNNDTICRLLGLELSKYDIGIVSAGSKPADKVISSMHKILSDHNAYTPEQLITYFRIKSKGCHTHASIGNFIFTGTTVADVRKAAFSRSCALIVIGGGAKTKEEALLARCLNFLIIPVEMTGGTASLLWYEQSRNLLNQHAHSNLSNRNPLIAVDAVISILRSHFILGESKIPSS